MEDKIKIIPLGGHDEFGKNLTVVEINDDIFVLNCGLKYPDKTKHGIDYIIPRFDYLIENKHKIRGYFITRGQDIVLGGLAYVIKRAPAKIYCTNVTKDYITSFAIHNHAKVDYDFDVVNSCDERIVANRKIRFFSTCTNSANSFGIAISTDQGNIVYIDDFVVDTNGDSGFSFNSKMLSTVSEENTLLCMLDSHYADKIGYTNPSYKLVPLIEQIFKDAQGRIFIAIENQDIYNIEKTIQLAIKNNRKIIAFDENTKDALNVVINQPNSYLTKSHFATLDDLNRMRPQDILVIMTGFGQRAFHKITLFASGNYDDKRLKLLPGDTFIIGLHVNNSNEIIFTDSVDELYKNDEVKIYYYNKRQFKLMYASQEDIKTMLSTFRPKYYVPTNGSYRQLLNNAMLSLDMGIGLNHMSVFVLDNGMVLSIDKSGARISPQKVMTGELLVDGLSIGDSDSDIISDRSTLSGDGVIVLGVVVDLKNKMIVGGPDVQTRGLFFVKDSEAILKEVTKLFINIIENELKNDYFDKTHCENEIRDIIFKAIRRNAQKSPLIIPLIATI
ncbi:MAG: ribonuclease J [Bacilli bacterium]|nr:ribonuclease J [Bacilli bacterium]